MRCRKLLREGHRRSPRISALDAWKAQPTRSPKKTRLSSSSISTTAAAAATEEVVVQQHKELEQQKENQPEGPASRTRAKKKRKLRPLQDVASTPHAKQNPKSSDVQDDSHTSHEDHPITSGEQNLKSSDVQDVRYPSREDHKGEQNLKSSNVQDDQQITHGVLSIKSDKPIVKNHGGPNHKDQPTSPVQPSSLPNASWMPEKHVLERIIDILQRRDTHEIFAEPVDPNEVEEYYEIIKEPMDFGTMRAKLHEGMYKSFEQFEHDVFLISGNAMHFNSSSTLYFRQARAIDELAKKVFHVLKTDPENFELEFSGMRRRGGKRIQHEARGSTNGSPPKCATSSKTHNTALNISTKPTSFLTSLSSLRKGARINSGFSDFTTYSDARDDEVHFGSGNGKRFCSFEADRRSTYKPWMSFLNENHPIIPSIYSNSKPLVHVNQQDCAYNKSLMWFVKDLGPTAQMVARRKLSGWSTTTANFLTLGSDCWHEAASCQNFAATTSAQWVRTPLDATITATTQNLNWDAGIDMCDVDRGGNACAGSKLGKYGTSGVVAPQSNHFRNFGGFSGEACFSDRTEVAGVSRTVTPQQNQIGGLRLGSHSATADARDLNFLGAGLSNKDNKRTELKLEKNKIDNKSQSLDFGFKNSESNALEHRLRDSCPPAPFSWPLKTTGIPTFDQNIGSVHNLSSHRLKGDDQAIAIQGPTHGLCGSPETVQAFKSSEPWMPISNQFTFDLPFLKTRLDQINSVGQNRLPLQSSGAQGPFLNRMSETYNDDYAHPSLSSQHTNLALQL